ncbi:hypothetical protein SKC41_02880 [Mycobacterium sp. 050128]|uniref:hypothetical protein n=1 Tax=Mycobacterium sp. 050128 TaxID=3096112 RepID=UPI002ED95421
MPGTQQLDESGLIRNPRRIANFEMGSADSYGPAGLPGHRACPPDAIVADRVVLGFSSLPAETLSKLFKLAIAQPAEPA